MVATPAEQARFFAKVSVQPGCWRWEASVDVDGYGQFRAGGKRWRSHRLSWALRHGPIPAGFIICHRCDNPRCVNPSHLFVGTHADNVADKIRKGRCGPTGARGPANGAVKVKDLPMDKIVALHRAGWGVREIAPIFGVSKSTIGNIIKGNHWSNQHGV